MTIHSTTWAASPRPSWPTSTNEREAPVFAAKHVSPAVEEALGARMAEYARAETKQAGFCSPSMRPAIANHVIRDKTESEIIAYLSENTWQDSKAVRAAVGRSGGYIKERLREMAADGRLVRTKVESTYFYEVAQ